MTDIDINQWDKELVVPPVENCLRLEDHLPPETRSFITSAELPKEILSYTWQEEATYEKVARWCKAAVHAGEVKQPDGAESFFIKPVKDAYDYDRAVRAAKALGRQPLRRSEIEERILRVLSSGEQLPYVLTEKPFEWTVETPGEAVDATASVLEAERPDRLWLAEYVQEHSPREQLRADAAEGFARMAVALRAEQSQDNTAPSVAHPAGPANRGKRKRRFGGDGKWDPIIYAEYGDWQVEAARWE